MHIDNKKKDTLVLGDGSIQELHDMTITAVPKYSINFIRSTKRFCLSLHYNGSNSYFFANTTKIYQFK